MRVIYLILTILGFAAPTYLVIIESAETGNWMLYKDPVHTFEMMFVNRISSIFSLDLLIAVFVFFVWTKVDAKKSGIRRVWLIWITTMLFGLAGGFPLYLYLKSKLKSTYIEA